MPLKWVTIHESRAGDTVPLVATLAAKAAGAGPFKRPENMAWLPDSKFRTFFFTTTGDTDAPTSGSLFRVDLREENFGKGGSKIKPLDDGMISIFVLGDQLHNSFDNLAFANEHQVSVAEDRGDTRHQ